MGCLFKFKWVKLLRAHLPEGKGVMSDWAKLAARVAFRKGQGMYCGYTNDVEVGSWVGGIMGVRSMLGVKSKNAALERLDRLQSLGYLEYELEDKTKKLTYRIKDWVLECTGKECENESDNVYAMGDYGFLCVPRTITERLIKSGHIFEEADAWLDLWVYTIYEEKKNFYSFFAPIVRFEKNSVFLSLEALSRRWGWEKTKTWRFFQKHKDVFHLHRLPGSYGCLIFNSLYPTKGECVLPTDKDVEGIIEQVRALSKKMKFDCAKDTISELVEFFSPLLLDKMARQPKVSGEENRVALFDSIIRAYFSPCWSCESCVYDCKGNSIGGYGDRLVETKLIRGPCEPSVACNRRTENGKENRRYARKGNIQRRGGNDTAFNEVGNGGRYSYRRQETTGNQADQIEGYLPQYRAFAQTVP